MKIKQSIFAIALAISASVQAIETAPITTIQGGSRANAVWYAPMSETYRVFVFVPDSATATNALYRIYPKGKKPNSVVCSAIEAHYPCIGITVNQALNKNQWVQLMVNNNVDTEWTFTRTKGYVTVASNKLNTTENLGVAGVNFVTLMQQKWAKAIASVSGIKLIISECLNDNAGNYTLCDSMDPSELGQYMASVIPPMTGLPTLTNGVVSIVPSTAAIQIIGDATLGGCTFQLQPFVNLTAILPSWQPKAVAAVAPSNGVAECAQYVKNATYLRLSVL